MFEPIAIVGRACLLPGANSPEELWQNVLTNKPCLAPLPESILRLQREEIANNIQRGILSSQVGGYVAQFEQQFDGNGFHLPAETLQAQDDLCKWLLHSGRAALHDAGLHAVELNNTRAGAIIGSLNYPTSQLSQYAEYTWLLNQSKETLGSDAYQHFLTHRPIAASRFMSGYPMRLLAQGLGLSAATYALDAACASSLYAIKMACDQLHARRADVMLAGGVNATDSLFLNIGFTALKALSKTGQSRPLHKEADGLIPAHGAALVVLKRMDEAVKAGDVIHGVIRGIGLSNDGQSKGFLAPDQTGQVRAMREAYRCAGRKPSDVSWVECHATGTPLGDETEIKSMIECFGKDHPVALGLLKATIGHTITTSGAAALINTLSGLKHQLMPPAGNAAQEPMALLHSTAFQLLSAPTEWTSNHKAPRLAAINCFGFGGNNAHLLVEEYHAKIKRPKNKITPLKQESIAIVGIGVVAASATSKQAFSESLFMGKSLLRPDQTQSLSGYIDTIELDIQKTRFSPSDLTCALGSQLAMLKSAQEACEAVHFPAPERISVFVGSQCSAEIPRTGLRWRLKTLLPHKSDAWLDTARELIHPPVQSAHVIGVMPNIITNRLNQLMDFRGPSFSLFDDETSGTTALDLGIASLQRNDADCVMIGAVDMCAELIHQTAMKELYPASSQPPGDAAVTLVLKRLSDAERDKDTIYALVGTQPDNQSTNAVCLQANNSVLTQRMGYSFAATGLVHIAAASLCCYKQLLPSDSKSSIKPWLASETPRQVEISVVSHQSHQAKAYVREYQTPLNVQTSPLPEISIFRAADRTALINALETNAYGQSGSIQLAIVAATAEEQTNLRKTAIHLLQENKPSATFPFGIFMQEKALDTNIAFVFTGATTSYAGMENDLLYHFPTLINPLAERVKSLPAILHILERLGSKQSINMFEELKAYSFLTQLHARFTQDVLGLRPQACIGYCSGESNALVAMGAWRDVDQFYQDIEDSGIYTDSLAGNYSALSTEWGSGDKWSAWRVIQDVAAVKAQLAKETFVRLTIINSPTDCIIAGLPDACEKFIAALKPSYAKRIEHSMIIHCDEFKPVAKLWHQIHKRKTYAVPGMHFYSGASGKWYEASAEKAANALVQQASATVDFSRVIQQAWADGIRVFIEHGPRNICSRWIAEILKDKDHLVISLDSVQRKSHLQMAAAVAQLILAGVDIQNPLFTVHGHSSYVS